MNKIIKRVLLNERKKKKYKLGTYLLNKQRVKLKRKEKNAI